MLPKINRLTRKKDFDLVFKRGKSARGGFLVVLALANNLSQSRFGFMVGKKVSKKAIIRNKIKRRLRSLACCATSKAVDFVVIALPGAEKESFLRMEKTLSSLIKKTTG